MTERQEVEAPAVDMYPRKILEYMEGFLISKVRKVVAESTHTHTCYGHEPQEDPGVHGGVPRLQGKESHC